MEADLISLITLAREGDEGAFSDLAARYKPLIESMAKSYSKRCANELYSEEDFVQEATMAFYSAVCSYKDGDVTFGLYAKVCVRNKLISLLRTASKKKKEGKAERGGYVEQSYRFLEKENYDLLEERISGVLSKLELSVLRLYVQKMSYDEIADILGISPKSVDNALYRMKKKLKRII